ncbi:5-deoxy-glucuronate isomerase [Geodermatophilus sp. YIM 151500]|uniref:5-deoxy-glucuronate isomerase n=1 Tax=Geodermatophilus sp. YIM 151500 TaxID=2984531 RepID=UPI0021E3EEA0|nr:5-deoxy-glucuronate isomerase [Geodermatophilus sp. YIM 151500]MCV2490303.1 5-deoxy-glucuronate isomerase [Geodermatophilus sp. YIM 151500]
MTTAARPAPARPGRSWHLPAGTAASGPFSLEVTPESAGWGHSSLRVLELAAGASHTLETGPDEVVVVPLAGSLHVGCDGKTLTLAGRSDVFAGPTDFAYLPLGATATLASPTGGRFALCGARASRRLPVRYGPAGGVPVELRGAGPCSRQVHNFATADVFEADSIIACEVITPGGNWSSYPPHKHDETSAAETELEEIYYFEVAPGPAGTPGLAYHRVYGTAERPIDVLAEVRDRDVVLVPHGWHGPSIAAPGHHLYYLNVMAGPGPERAWRIVDDPDHAWIRGTWADEDVDPRLPLHAPARPSQNGASRP